MSAVTSASSFVIVPQVVVALDVTVTENVPSESRDPMSQRRVSALLPSPVSSEQGDATSLTSSGALAIVHVTPVGSVSVSVTPLAESGPWFVTVRSNDTGLPCGTDFGFAALVSSRSARSCAFVTSIVVGSTLFSTMPGVVKSSVGPLSVPSLGGRALPVDGERDVVGAPGLGLGEVAVGVVRQPEVRAGVRAQVEAVRVGR